MKEIIMSKKPNDCLKCSLSELLNIPYEDIPDFELDSNAQYVQINDFLEHNNLVRINIAYRFGDTLPFYLSHTTRCLGILSKQDKPYVHCVVLNMMKGIKKECVEIEILDSKENSGYTLDDLSEIEFIFKKKE